MGDTVERIGGGLGQFAGRVWRIGLMGHFYQFKNVFLLLAALESVLKLCRALPWARTFWMPPRPLKTASVEIG
jgi:aspartate aminotransferase-like enzyme